MRHRIMALTFDEYQELINLEGLDRWLNDDVRRFMTQGDQAGAELAELSRREVQNRMLQLTLKNEA